MHYNVQSKNKGIAEATKAKKTVKKMNEKNIKKMPSKINKSNKIYDKDFAEAENNLVNDHKLSKLQKLETTEATKIKQVAEVEKDNKNEKDISIKSMLEILKGVKESEEKNVQTKSSHYSSNLNSSSSNLASYTSNSSTNLASYSTNLASYSTNKSIKKNINTKKELNFASKEKVTSYQDNKQKVEITHAPFPKKNEEKKKKRKKLTLGIIKVKLTKNNVFINVTNIYGKTIIKLSAGNVQKKKNKKALFSITKILLSRTANFVRRNFHKVNLIVKGNPYKSLMFLKRINAKRIKIKTYENLIPLVHNGCRPPKKRRL